MMAHNQDWLEWLLSLNANGAEYVIVGGVALALTRLGACVRWRAPTTVVC
jgi:hypothetical protein